MPKTKIDKGELIAIMLYKNLSILKLLYDKKIAADHRVKGSLYDVPIAILKDNIRDLKKLQSIK